MPNPEDGEKIGRCRKLQNHVSLDLIPLFQGKYFLGPIQMPCYCRAELISGSTFHKSTAEELRLNQTFELSFDTQRFDKLCRATRLWHGNDSNVVLLPRQTKIANYINVFWRDCVPAGLACCDSGTTSESESCFCRATVSLQGSDVRTGP